MSVRSEEPAKKADSAPGWTGATTAPTRLLLLRHGQSPMSVKRLYSGSASDPSLTDVGLAQAANAAEFLRREVDAGKWDISAIVASPQARAQQTAEAAANALGLDIHTEQDLRETDFGAWEGLTFSQAREATPSCIRSGWGTRVSPRLRGKPSRTSTSV